MPHRRDVRVDALRLRTAAPGSDPGHCDRRRGHEGRGIGLLQKLQAYALQDAGSDTVQANLQLGLSVDSRSYDAAAAMLKHLGVSTLRLLSNNPDKVAALESHGLVVTERVPLQATPNHENLAYLQTKQDLLGHALDLETRRQHDTRDPDADRKDLYALARY